MKKKELILSLLLLISLVMSIGYAKGAKITEEELLEKAVAAWENVKTVQFDIEVTMDTEIGKQGATAMSFKESYKVKGYRVVDETSNEQKLKMTIEIPAETEVENEELTIYIIENWIYLKMIEPGKPEQWTKSEIPAEYMNKLNQIKHQFELVKASKIEKISEEKVEGIDCYAVKVEPDIEELWKIVQQLLMMPEQMLENLSGLREMLKSGVFKQWLSKDDYLPIKEQIIIEIGSENVIHTVHKEEKMDLTLKINISIVYHNYKEKVSIELPYEAKNAVEVPWIGGE